MRQVVSQAAAEKLAFLNDPTLPLPDVLQRALLEFARAAKAAARPAPVVKIEARSYYQPEVVGLSLTAYAAKREAEQKGVTRESQLTSEIKPMGRAEILATRGDRKQPEAIPVPKPALPEENTPTRRNQGLKRR